MKFGLYTSLLCLVMQSQLYASQKAVVIVTSSSESELKLQESSNIRDAIDLQDKNGWTALMHAAYGRALYKRVGEVIPETVFCHVKDCVIILLNRGANPYIQSYDEKEIGKRYANAPQAILQMALEDYPNKTFFNIDTDLLQDPDILEALVRTSML